MKKLAILLAAVFAVGIHAAFAQRGSTKTITTTKLAGVQETFEYTEAFSLEAGHEMLVVPLVAEVEVLPAYQQKKAIFTGKDRADGEVGCEYLVTKFMDGKNVIAVDVETLKAQVIYDFCRETQADLIVLPQFNIRHKMEKIDATDENGKNVKVDVPVEQSGKYVMIVDMVGFPAHYTKFRTGRQEDRWVKDILRQGKTTNEDSHIHVEEETITKTK